MPGQRLRQGADEKGRGERSRGVAPAPPTSDGDDSVMSIWGPRPRAKRLKPADSESATRGGHRRRAAQHGGGQPGAGAGCGGSAGLYGQPGRKGARTLLSRRPPRSGVGVTWICRAVATEEPSVRVTAQHSIAPPLRLSSAAIGKSSQALSLRALGSGTNSIGLRTPGPLHALVGKTLAAHLPIGLGGPGGQGARGSTAARAEHRQALEGHAVVAITGSPDAGIGNLGLSP